MKGREPEVRVPLNNDHSNVQPLLSIVVPCYNEEESICAVLEEVADVLDPFLGGAWECIVVDDGSRDRSVHAIREFLDNDARFRLLEFERNASQSAAFDAGFRAARGEYIGMMDGDGQNDPRDFPRLLAELRRRKVDMVCGIRKKRQDTFVRKIASRIANGVRNWATGESVTDVGCSIRVFRRACYRRIKLYRGMHRFFPTLFKMEGFRIGEIPVNHRPRKAGRSKYGIHNRMWAGLRDLFAVRWMQSRALKYRVKAEHQQRSTRHINHGGRLQPSAASLLNTQGS